MKTHAFAQAEAVWASALPLLEELCDQGVDKFGFVTDGPLSQYR